MSMTTPNNIFAAIFAIISLASTIGVFCGAKHQAIIAAMAAMMAIVLRAEAKKEANENA